MPMCSFAFNGVESLSRPCHESELLGVNVGLVITSALLIISTFYWTQSMVSRYKPKGIKGDRDYRFNSEGDKVLFTDDRFEEQVLKQADPKDALYAPSSVLYAGLERTWINYSTYTMVLKIMLTGE